jgi:glycosyltransferase involved in cell wall biosynthesis
MKDKLMRVLLVGQSPPPIDGQTLMIQTIIRGQYDGVKLSHVRTEISRHTGEVGAFQPRKLVMVVRALFKILAGRWKSRAQVLYYLPAGPMLFPVLRDIFLLTITRWLFRFTVFHFQAAGLTEIYTRLPWWLQPLFNVAYGKPDLAIFPTPSTAHTGTELQARVVSVIPNCIADMCQDLPSAPVSNEEQIPQILFMGVLCEGKGVLTLIHACSLLQNAGLQLKVVCAGAFASPAFQSELTTLVETLGLREVIRFPGVLTGEAKLQVFRESAVFCFPSHYYAESFGIVLIEAMCCGLPIVTTQWRGLPDVAGGSGGAFIVEPKRPDLVAAKLQALLLDADLRRSMGRKNREWFCDHYTLEIFETGIEQALQSLGQPQEPAAQPLALVP